MNKTKIIVGVIILLVILLTAYFWAQSPASVPADKPGVSATSTSPAELMTIKVFFGNRFNDPKSLYCERTYPSLRRVPKTEDVAKVALTQMLAGPTEVEKTQGFFTAINSGVQLLSLSIRNGIAYADFDSRLGEKVAGSCLVSAIRAQIEDTLKQFPAIDSVVVSIAGQSEDILQP